MMHFFSHVQQDTQEWNEREEEREMYRHWNECVHIYFLNVFHSGQKQMQCTLKQSETKTSNASTSQSLFARISLTLSLSLCVCVRLYVDVSL